VRILRRVGAIISTCLFLCSCGYHLQRILIIGDSISLGYTPIVEDMLEGRAIVDHAVEQPNKKYPGEDLDNNHDSGQEARNVTYYLSGKHYDIVYFNAGVWDMLVKTPDCRSNVSLYAHTIPEYLSNLQIIVTKIKASGAEPIFATTTAETSPPYCGVTQERVDSYNIAAISLMQKLRVRVDNLHAAMLPYNSVYAEEPGRPDVHYNDDGYLFLAYKVADFLGY
jgi:lysophospholipase L1-like esterase